MENNISKPPRTTGILLHPSSLPNSPVCGTFGSPAREWLRLLASNGIGVWQFLPIATTDKTGSPYSSPSSFSYNPWFLDVDDLVNQGFLPISIAKDLPGSACQKKNSVDFRLADLRSQKVGEYLRKYWDNQNEEKHREFDLWRNKQFWLEDHAMFMELRRQYDELPWWKWPSCYSHYEKSNLEVIKEKFQDNLLEHYLLQWHLDRQWNALRKFAKDLGVLLFGDLPFYVSRDSSDVWSRTSLFSIYQSGELSIQSGVPPDYFSETGQLWGTPVYRWRKHKSTRYRWWRSRFLRHFQQADLLRIDHFRALDSYWAVPGQENTAENGYWRPSPGLKLLSFLRKELGGKLPLVAEDLGVITPEVESLRDYFSLPGMKILQFAFDGNPNNPYLPENINGSGWIVYTGTHDNATTMGWWNELNDEVKNYISTKFNESGASPVWRLIEIGLATEAKLFVAPIQDLLSLDNASRFNKPGTIDNNWSWRLTSFDDDLNQSLRMYGELGKSYERSFFDAFLIL